MRTIKQELSEKIDNEFHYQLILGKHGYGIPASYGTFQLGGVRHVQMWWAHRESLRIEHGVYESSTPLHTLNAMLPVFSHIALADPKRVAYTPDKDSGERDRQLVLNLGRLLTRHYPGLKDEVIQDFVAQHEAETSLEVEFIECDKISETYLNMPTGACMSYDLSRYGGHAPTDAYNVPGSGLRMAVLRNKEGKISARTLVYEPTPEDKRYIRCYGDGTLQRRLMRRGYVAGTLHGFKFNTVKLTPGIFGAVRIPEDAYVIPYLDANGRMGSPHGSYVALLDGAITSITEGYAEQISRCHPEAVFLATKTVGFAVMKNVDTSEFNATDCVTGETISKLERNYFCVVNGVLGITLKVPQGYLRSVTLIDGQTQLVFMDPSAVTVVNYDRYDTRYLSELGFVKPDAEWYPEGQWCNRRDLSETKSGRLALPEDCVSVILNMEHKDFFHNSEIRRKGKDKHIKLTAKVYAEPTAELFVTASGRRVHPLAHNIVKLYTTGRYEYQRNAIHVTALGRSVWIGKGENTPSGLLKVNQKRIDEALASSRAFSEHAGGNSLKEVAMGCFRLLTGGSRFRKDSYYDQVQLDDDDTPSRTLAKIGLIAVTRYDHVASRAARYAAEVLYAEMCAVEAPHRLEPAAVDRPDVIELPPVSDSVTGSVEKTLTEAGVSETLNTRLQAASRSIQEVAETLVSSHTFTRITALAQTALTQTT